MLLLIRAGLRAPPRVPGLRLSKAPLQVQKRSHSLYCHVHTPVILTTYQIDNKILKIIKKNFSLGKIGVSLLLSVYFQMVTSYRFFDIYLYKQDYDIHKNKTFSHSDLSLDYFINFF